MKNNSIRILIVEDRGADAELYLRELRRAGFDLQWKRVDSEPAYLTALDEQPDLILSDFSMPQFDGLRALRLLRARDSDIPFILISGTIGEEAAVEAIKQGANDYLIKDRITRLASAVQRVLNDRQLLDERRRVEAEHQRGQEQIRQLAETQTSILNALPAHIALLDSEGVVRAANESWRRFAESNALRSPDHGVGTNYLEVCEQAEGEWADEARAAAAGIRRVLRGEIRDFVMEYSCHAPDEPRWFRLMATPLIEAPYTGAVVMHINVTDRRLAEEALRRSNQAYAQQHDALMALTQLGFSLTGEELGALQQFAETVASATRAARVSLWRFNADRSAIVCQDLFQSSSSEHTCGAQLLAASFPAYFEALNHCDVIAAGDARHDPRTAAFTEEYLTPLGIGAMLDAPIRVGGVLDGVLCIEHVGPSREWTPGEQTFAVSAANLVSLAISQRAQARSESRLRTILESVPECVMIVSLDGTVRSLNSAGLQMMEAGQMDEVVGHDVWRLIHPEDRDMVARFHRRAGNGETGLLQFRIIGLKGIERWLESQSVPLREGSESINSVLSVCRDITGHRRAEQQIREQAALLDNATDAIVVRDLEHRVLYWNRSAERVYGWSAMDIRGTSIRELLPCDDKQFEAAMQALFKHGEWVGELQYQSPGRQPLTLDCRWTLVRDDAGQPKSVLAIETDITEKKKLEAQFLRAQRMESIGTLAGGIAHDLNNMLAPVMMSIELLRMRLPDNETKDILNTMQGSVQRGADLVKQVLSFARGVEGKHIVVNPGHLVREIQKVVRDTFPKAIVLDTLVEKNIWLVNADPTQLHQVLLNLCVNARDAMPDGGKLSISLKNVVLDEVYAGMNPEAQPGSYVAIRVADTGTGIPPDIMERIFDPFFTTKEIGKGTGLGLSTTLAIVKSHGGFMNVYSEPGSGTTFKVCLPAKSCAEVMELTEVEQAGLPRGNDELVLLVDDEESIRMIAQRSLERFGYRVLPARHGAEAVSIYAQHRTEIAVVITDMAMPIMDGPALIVALRAMNPAVKIIGSSGLTLNSGMTRAIGAGVEHFIPKPYTAESMLRILHDTLRKH